MNEKGFAATGILYTVLVLFILLMFGILNMLNSRNNLLTRIQKNVKGELLDVVETNYGDILSKAKALVYAADGETCKIDADASDTTTYKYMDGCYIKGTSETNVAAASNYVWYNGFMWRIMGINSDGTVRLITDETVTAIPYGAADTALTYTTNEGYIHDWLNEYFYNHLNSSITSIIKQGAYFCSESTNDIQLEAGRNECDEDYKVDTRIGIISIDEYLLSMIGNDKPYSYLNILQVQRTMTPINKSRLVYVDSVGDVIWNQGNATSAYGVRPVINVNPDAVITRGDGSVYNFFILEENKTNYVTGEKLFDVATSGEYVSLKGKTYRVVSKDNNIGIKLIFDGYYLNDAGKVVTTTYGSTKIFNKETGIGQKLNEDVLGWLGLSDSTKIVETDWDQGSGVTTGFLYSKVFDGTPDISAKVGLIALGEMLSSQSSTIVTKNYTYPSKISSGGAAQSYWLLTKSSTSDNAWRSFKQGNAGGIAFATNSFAIRPVITVSNDVVISGGNGTWTRPYEI